MLLLVLALTLLVGIAIQRQSAQASPSRFTVAIIGGAIVSHKPSHITIATTPEAHVGMRIFYRCPSVTRIVYPNQNANALGRYTWGWSQGAPCNSGTAVIIVTGSKAGQIFVAQKTFLIAHQNMPHFTLVIVDGYFTTNIASGGTFPASRQSHVTISAPLGSLVGMHIIYYCTAPNKTVDAGIWANQAVDATGGYTWVLNGGVPCYEGSAQVFVEGQKSGQQFTTQKSFSIVPFPAPTSTPSPMPISTPGV